MTGSPQNHWLYPPKSTSVDFVDVFEFKVCTCCLNLYTAACILVFTNLHIHRLARPVPYLPIPVCPSHRHLLGVKKWSGRDSGDEVRGLDLLSLICSPSPWHAAMLCCLSAWLCLLRCAVCAAASLCLAWLWLVFARLGVAGAGLGNSPDQTLHA